MAKLKTIDAIRTSVQSMKKYVDNKLPRIDIKQDVIKTFDVSSDLEDPWYPEFVTDTLGLIPNVEHKIIVSVDGVSYHGRFTPELYDPGYVGVVNFVEDGIENIFFDDIDGFDNAPRCLGFINLFDKMIFDPDLGEVFDETKATIHFSVGEYEDGTIETITGVEIIIPDEQNVLLTGEVLQQELDKKQNKLTYKESAAKSYKIEIDGRPGDVLVDEESPCYIIDYIGLVSDRYYTVKMKLHEIPVPSSLTSEGEPAKLYDIPMNINVDEASFEADFENNILIYKLPAYSIPKDLTGFDVDVLMLSSALVSDSSGLSIDFEIYDNLIIDEYGTPFYLEDKGMFTLNYEYFSSLIEYVEIIPEVSSEDMVEVEVNNEFLETHRFITEEERKRWNEKQDAISDAFYLRKIPQMDNTDSRAIQDKTDLIRSMTDGLYVATYDIYFYGESAYTGITLEDGIEDGDFPIYKNDIIQFVNVGDTAQYCGIFNYSSGKACVLDVDAGIVWIGSTTGAYLGDIEELFQYKCLEESVTYTKEQIYSTMIGGTSYKEYQFNVDFLLEEDKKYHIRYEDLDGKIYEYEDVGQNDGEISGKTIIKLYDNEFNVIVSTHESTTEGHPSVLKVKVYNSSGLNDFGKITICKVEYLSSEFLDKYRFVTNEEKEKWNNKTDRDDVYELLPAYDTRGTETITYEYDKIEEGKVTAYEYYEGREVQRFVKVADLTAEEFDVYAEKMKYDSGSSFTQELEETLGEYVYNSTFEGNSFYKFTDADENEVDTILYANACVYFVKQPYSASYIEFPEAGVYFQTYSEWNLKYPLKMTINIVSGELKVIDKKYLVNSPGRIFDPYSIEYYDSDINTTFKYRSGEVFNNESNMALEFDSHAEGKETKALGSYSHTEGHKTLASGEASHAEGGGTKARGKYSHAEGFNSHALAQAAHAEGESTRAESSASHAEGRNTIALGYGQHVQGRFNIEDEYKYAHIVGNGDYDARSNAHTLDWDGNAWFAGNVTIGADNKELATQEYIDNKMTGLANVATSGSYNDLKNKPTIKKSDWEENDTSDAAYIYGRTHWKEKRYGPETEFGQIAQSYGYWNSNEPDNIIYASTIVPPLGRPVIRLEVGTTYTVTIDRYDDGTVDEYECVCQQHSEYEYIKVLGDTSFSTMPIYIEDDGDYITASLQYGGDNINVIVSGQRPIEQEIYHKLSMDYLPSSVATKAYVDEAIANNVMTQDEFDLIAMEVFGSEIQE